MKKLVHGVGINDEINQQAMIRSDSRVVRIYTDPIYTRWVGMLQRCYSKVWKNRHPSYTFCNVCEEWKTYSKFKAWLLKQSNGHDLLNYDLDKDLLFPDISLYSPSTCCLIPRYINRAITRRYRPGLKTGVRLRKGMFCAQIVIDSKKVWLGTFSTGDEAHEAWKLAKIKELKRLQSQYKDDRLYDERVDDALSRCIHKLETEKSISWIL